MFSLGDADMDTEFIPKTKDPFRISKLMYIIEALLEYYISILVTGTYLAKLTTTIGISDSTTALLSSIATFSGMFQLVSIYLAQRTPLKRWLIPMSVLTQLLFASVYLIPLIGGGFDPSWLFFFIILIANALKTIASPIKYTWFTSLVEERRRGAYASVLTMVSIIGSMIFTVAISAIIDYYDRTGNINGAFSCLAIIIIFTAVLHTATLIISKENRNAQKVKPVSPFRSIGELMHNKRYVRLLILYVMISFSSCFVTPFLSTYLLNELAFSLTFISVIDVVIGICQVFFLYFAGRYSMRHSYITLRHVSIIFQTVSMLAVVFMKGGLAVPMYIFYRLTAAATGATASVSASTMLFSVAAPEHRTAAISLNTIIIGTLSFFMTLLATPLVNYVQKNGMSVFGIEIYAQQLLALISVFLAIPVFIYYHVFCKKQFKDI